jgi:glutamate carboxypeptidase
MSTLCPFVKHSVESAHEIVKQLYPNFIDDLKFLVSMDRGSSYKSGLDKAIDWMAGQLNGLVSEVDIRDDGLHGKNLIARVKGNGKGRWVIYGHMDTVWEEGVADVWKFKIDGERAFGPGVVDNTGGSLTGLYTLRVLSRLGYDNFEEIIFVNNSDEEIDSPSSKHIFYEVSRGADFALCFESPSFANEIIGERAGAANYYINIRGKGAHTGVSPEEGIDAGHEAALKIAKIFEIKGEDSVLYPSVVYIRAGSEINTVCDNAEFKVFFRIKSYKEFHEVTQKIQEIVDTSYVQETESTLRVEMNHGPMERLAGSDKLSSTFIEVASLVGLALNDVWCGGCADSSFTSEVGVPTICGVGPFGQNYHTRDEFLDVSSIIPRVTSVVGTIIALSEELNTPTVIEKN